MKEFNFTVTDENGIHARPAGQLVKEAKSFNSSITVEKGDKSSDMKKLLKLMRRCPPALTGRRQRPA